MSDDVNFGLSPDRIRQLLECKPTEGLTPAKPVPKSIARTPKVKTPKPAFSELVAKIGLSRERVQALLPKVVLVTPRKPKKVKEPKVDKRSYDYQRANDPRLAGMTDDEIRRYKVKQYQLKHRKKQKAYHKKWRKANPEKFRATALKYYQKNKERINARLRLWNKNNPEKCRAIKRRYRILRKFRDLA
jgi:hypothetical protein